MSFITETLKTGRNSTADLLKGIAVILMIQVHLTELFALQEIYDGTFGRISLFLGGPPAAPLFMLVMGYFAVYKSSPSKKLLIRGIKLLGGGLLLNIGLNFNLLVSIFTGGYYYYLDPWKYIFGADILPLAGLSLILFSLITRIFKSSYIAYFILAVVIVSVQPYLPVFGSDGHSWLLYINAFLWGNIEWSYFPLVPWIAYPLTGAGFYYLQKSFSYRNEKIKMIYLFLWVIFIIFTIGYGIKIASDLKIYYHHNTLYYLWTIVFLSGFCILVEIINKKYNEKPVMYFQWIGQNVTAAYVFQWIIIGNISPAVYKTQDYPELIFWFAGIIAAVTFMIYMFLRYKNNRRENNTENKVRIAQ